MATLKTILDAVMGESGFLIPTSYATSTNQDDLQLLHLANAASDEIRDYGLVQLRDSASVTLTSATDYALPADFHAYIPDTAYSGTFPASLPTTPQEWALETAIGEPSANYSVRFLGDRVHVKDPVPGETITYEYLSSYPWSSSGVPKEVATADTDEWRLDRRLLILGVKWRWKKEKGMEDWQVDQQLYQRHLNMLRGRNEGAKTLMFGEARGIPLDPYTRLWV